MAPQTFSINWKSSTQPRKQRKYRYNAPLHLKQKLMHVHLSKDLRTKYGFRAFQVKKGDKVCILRGQYKKREGKVDRVDLKHEKVYVSGIDYTKKEGTKVLFPLRPSNLLLLELDLGDKKRKQKIDSKKESSTKRIAGEKKK